MKDYPVIKVAILFVAGILSASFFLLGIYFIIPSLLLTISLILFYKRLGDKTLYSILIFLVTGILVFSIGNYLAIENAISYNHFITKIDKVKNTTAVGEITKLDLIRNNELIFYLAIDSVYLDEFLIKDRINILCKARLDNKSILELYSELKPGNKLKVKGFYHRGKQKRNPGEFDYDAYLKSKEIPSILSIDKITSIIILEYDTNIFANVIHQIRKTIDWQIKKYHSPETAALLRGLLLADRGEIKYQTKTPLPPRLCWKQSAHIPGAWLTRFTVPHQYPTSSTRAGKHTAGGVVTLATTHGTMNHRPSTRAASSPDDRLLNLLGADLFQELLEEVEPE